MYCLLNPLSFVGDEAQGDSGDGTPTLDIATLLGIDQYGVATGPNESGRLQLRSICFAQAVFSVGFLVTLRATPKGPKRIARGLPT
jgi:hypothetical protein